VIDLDNVWKWLDFTAKRILEQIFVLDKDYTKSLHFQVKQSTTSLLLQKKQKGTILYNIHVNQLKQRVYNIV